MYIIQYQRPLVDRIDVSHVGRVVSGIEERLGVGVYGEVASQVRYCQFISANLDQILCKSLTPIIMR